MKSRSRFWWIAVALLVDCCRAFGGLLSRFWWIAVALLVDCCRAFGGLLSRFARVSRWETTTGPSPYPTSTREGRGRPAGGAHRLHPTEQKQPAHPSLVIVDPVSAALADADTSQTGPARTFLGLLSQEAATAGCGVLLVAHDTKSARNLAMAGQDPGAGAVAGSAAGRL